MAQRLSKQSFELTALNLMEVNDALKRMQDELDRLAGLRGVILTYDSTQYVDDAGNIIHAWGAKP